MAVQPDDIWEKARNAVESQQRLTLTEGLPPGTLSGKRSGPARSNGTARTAKDPGRSKANSTRDRRRFELNPQSLEGEGAIARRLRTVMGKGELAGIFRRTNELVHTPRIGEDGYMEPEPGDDLGPAQVRPLTRDQLTALVSARFDVGDWTANKRIKGGPAQWRELIVPARAVGVAYEDARMGEDAPNVRELRMVTHTPTLRPDGTVLDQPGYDASTGLLYLPDPRLTVPPVPDRPTTADVKAATALLLEPVAGFPFVSDDHRANWAGMMLTPLLRSLVKRPYMGGIVTAPTRGTGKTALVKMVMHAHGGVLRGELPRDGEEMEKVVFSILSDTTAPVIVFDNLTGIIRSSVLEALMTAEELSARPLGVSRFVTVPNDRVWLFTGNNAKIGGDLVRRMLFIKLDAKMPDPHKRTFGFSPEAWVLDHRGELLAVRVRGVVDAASEPTIRW